MVLRFRLIAWPGHLIPECLHEYSKKVAHLRDTVSLAKLMFIFRMNFRFHNGEVKLPKRQISHRHVRIGTPYLVGPNKSSSKERSIRDKVTKKQEMSPNLAKLTVSLE